MDALATGWPVPVTVTVENAAMNASDRPSAVSVADIQAFLRQEFPQTRVTVEAVGGMAATVRHAVGFAELRPGGTVSGPVMMALADVALYVALFGEIGIVPLAVTTSLSFNFMRKPAGDRDLLAHCRLLKVGRHLVVGEVAIHTDGEPGMVAHAVGTYAIPTGAAPPQVRPARA